VITLYKCKKCGNDFPVPAWMEIPYDKVIPESLIGEISDLAKRVIRKPCCPFCYTPEIEEVKEKMSKEIGENMEAIDFVDKLFESEQMRAVTKLMLLDNTLLSPRGQSMASMGMKKLVELGIRLPWEPEVAVKTT